MKQVEFDFSTVEELREEIKTLKEEIEVLNHRIHLQDVELKLFKSPIEYHIKPTDQFINIPGVGTLPNNFTWIPT